MTTQISKYISIDFQAEEGTEDTETVIYDQLDNHVIRLSEKHAILLSNIILNKYYGQ